MEMFDLMWENQKKFNIKAKSNLRHQSKQEWINYFCLAMNMEISEFLNETNWKVHREIGHVEDAPRKLEELVDIFKYFMMIAQESGFTAQQIVEEYFRKSQIVEERYLYEIRDSVPKKLIAGVDIDGVLADYPDSFISFVNDQIGSAFKSSDWGIYDLSKIFTRLGITQQAGAELKKLYRTSGQKRFIKPFTGAADFLKFLKSKGYYIVLVTSRPYKEYQRIMSDTMYWLAANDMTYDTILWDEDKGSRLVNEFGVDNVDFFIEDYHKYANDIAVRGITCYLFNRAYNFTQLTHDNVVRVNTFNEIKDQMYRRG